MAKGDRPAVLVTGATGQIGRALVARLLADSGPVIALRHRRQVPDSAPGLTWVDGDLSGDALDLSGVAAVRAVHATGLWLLPRHLRALRDIGVTRLVAFGTTSIFGKADSRDGFERRQIAAITEAEQAVIEQCADLGIAWTILRPTLTYGAGLDLNVSAAARIIDRFGVFPVAGPARGLRQPVHADDLALAAVKVLAAPNTEGKVYNLAGGETLAYREMIGRIFDALERPRRLLRVPFLGALLGVWGSVSRNQSLTADVAARMNRDLVFNFEEAARDFGYAPRAFLPSGRADLGL